MHSIEIDGVDDICGRDRISKTNHFLETILKREILLDKTLGISFSRGSLNSVHVFL